MNKNLIDNIKEPWGQQFTYDRLYRLKESRFYNTDGNPWQITDSYLSSYSYDANGNFLNLNRKEADIKGLAEDMDVLTYNYQSGTNKLDYVIDMVNEHDFTHDIDSQNRGNYDYDATGNLISDISEGLTIEWTPSGKISSIIKDDGTVIRFLYDPAGNRVIKTIHENNIETSSDFYVRDAQGNIMSVYRRMPGLSGGLYFKLEEQPIYGSARLGTRNNTDYIIRIVTYDLLGSTEIDFPLNYTGLTSRTIGLKQYELTDHLGNVRVVFGDKLNGSVLLGTLLPEVFAVNNYYPYGMLINSLSLDSKRYRWGFGGHEKDDAVKGIGDHLSFGDYGYDTRLGRRWRPDPLMSLNATWSPFVFGLNNPIVFVDDEGEWPGVTFFFFEFDVGAGLSYGLNYVEQSGLAYDEVGKTHFVMTNAIYIVNQNLKEGSQDPNLIVGASISLTGNIKQNWSAETFAGIVNKGISSYPLPMGKAGVGLSVNIGFSEDELTIGAGIGAGAKISYVNTRIKESISLTDAEAKQVSKLTDVWADKWIVFNSQPLEGKEAGFQATVATRNTKGELIDTGISIFSESTTNDKGISVPKGVWMSKSYQAESNKAEKKK